MSTVTPASRDLSFWSRIRVFGAVAGVVVLLGTAAMAPFSMTTTTAYALDEYEAAMIERHQDHQQFSSAPAETVALDLDIEAVEEVVEPPPVVQSTEEPASEEPATDEPAAEAPPAATETPSDALYTLDEFTFSGVINWGGYKFTYYSQQVLPGPGLNIPGRHVNAAGYVSDGDGYIVLAGDAPKGTVYPTPFGYSGKIYDRGTVGNHLDVYIR